jgi:hypothetical protein
VIPRERSTARLGTIALLKAIHKLVPFTSESLYQYMFYVGIVPHFGGKGGDRGSGVETSESQSY